MLRRQFTKIGRSGERLASNLTAVFRLFLHFPRTCFILRIYNCYFSRKLLHYFALLIPFLLRVVPPPRCLSSRSRLSSANSSIPKCLGKTGQYVILTVSLFRRTKASPNREKPRRARNGRNPGMDAAWATDTPSSSYCVGTNISRLIAHLHLQSPFLYSEIDQYLTTTLRSQSIFLL